MKRWFARICVLLLLGAIVNVAVAWGVSLRIGMTDSTMRTLASSEFRAEWRRFAPSHWPTPALSDLPGNWMEGERYEYVCRSTDVLWLHVNDANGDWLIYVLASGWPLVAFEGAKLHANNSSVTLDGLFDSYELLPAYPIWPGFAINTVFYAVVLWMLFAAPFALRRRWRRGRGLCPKCAYDLRAMPTDSNACPECGTSVPPPLRAGVRGRVEHTS